MDPHNKEEIPLQDVDVLGDELPPPRAAPPSDSPIIHIDTSASVSKTASPQGPHVSELQEIPDSTHVELDTEFENEQDYKPLAITQSVSERGLWGPLLVKVLGEPKPIVAVIFQAFVSLLCSGIVYGWPAVVFMLNSEGVYHELCADPSNPTAEIPLNVKCAARNLKFATIYNVGVAFSVASYLWYGLSVDKLGPLYTNMISTTFAAIGCFIFGISSPDLPLYLVGYIFIGGAGVGVHLSSFHLGNPFPGHKGLILSMYAGIFNVSGIIFAIFSLLYSTLGFSMRALFIGHSVLLLVVSLMVPWYQTKSSLVPAASPAPVRAASGDSNSDSFFSMLSDIGKSPLPKLTSIEEFFSQLKQPLFWYMALWVVIHLVRIAFYAGTVTTQMLFFGDDQNQFYGKLAAWTIPLVPLFTFPVVGRMMDKFGLLMALPMANVFQILFGLLSLVAHLPLQFITFISYALGRQFFFGTYFALVINVFGQRHFGKISGMALFIAGVCVVGQTPLISIIDKTLGGNFALVNLIETLLFLPLFHFPLYLWKKGRSA